MQIFGSQIRNIEKLMSASSRSIRAFRRTVPRCAALRCAVLPKLAPTAPGRHFINMQQATCECCALSSHPISPGLNQSESPHRTQTMPFNGALRVSVCVCALARVLWSLPSSFSSARLHLSK